MIVRFSSSVAIRVAWHSHRLLTLYWLMNLRGGLPRQSSEGRLGAGVGSSQRLDFDGLNGGRAWSQKADDETCIVGEFRIDGAISIEG